MKSKSDLEKNTNLSLEKHSFPQEIEVAENLKIERLAQDAETSIDKNRILELTNLNKAAAAKILSRDQIMAVLSHDLKNPINTILMASEIIQENVPDQELYTAMIKKNSYFMMRMIEDLLDAERVTNGNLELKKNVYDLRDILKDTKELFESICEREKGITFKVHIPTEPIYVEVDYDRLMQVMMNLIGNAIKFTPRGNEIIIFTEVKDGSVSVMCQDSGIGISESNLKIIFQKFSQVLGPDRSGLGLGLFIAKKIITLHGSYIKIHSEVGAGSTFSFQLKISK